MRASLPANHPLLLRTHGSTPVTPPPPPHQQHVSPLSPTYTAFSNQTCQASDTGKPVLSDTAEATAICDTAEPMEAEATTAKPSNHGPAGQNSAVSSDTGLTAAAGMETRLRRATAGFLSVVSQQDPAEEADQLHESEENAAAQLESHTSLAQPEEPLEGSLHDNSQDKRHMFPNVVSDGVPDCGKSLDDQQALDMMEVSQEGPQAVMDADVVEHGPAAGSDQSGSHQFGSDRLVCSQLQIHNAHHSCCLLSLLYAAFQ